MKRPSTRAVALLLLMIPRAHPHFHLGDFAGLGVSAVGIDYVSRFSASGRGLYARADIRSLPFADGAFDAIVCYSVLHYVGGGGQLFFCGATA